MRRIYLEVEKKVENLKIPDFWSRWLKTFAVNNLTIPSSVKLGDVWFNCQLTLLKGKKEWQAVINWGEIIQEQSQVYCGLGLLKSFYMDLVLRGLSESIITKVFLVSADHTVGRANSISKKRWNNIILEHSAIKGRLLPLKIFYVKDWPSVIEASGLSRFVALDKSGSPLSEKTFQNSFCFFVGPEGGFSKREIDSFKSWDLEFVTLGSETFSSWFSAVSFASYTTLVAGLNRI